MINSSRAQFEEATTRFEAIAEHGLSFTDVMTIVMGEHHGVDAVLSFDDDFDGVIDRLDPATVPAQE
jgi:predicted nucleic acid-binding protein